MSVDSSISHSIMLEEHVALDKGYTPITLEPDCSPALIKQVYNKFKYEGEGSLYDPLSSDTVDKTLNYKKCLPHVGQLKNAEQNTKIKVAEQPENKWVDTLLSNSKELETKLSRDEEVYLGDYFLPGEWDVICGRGKHGYDHTGNRRFRILIAMNLKKYVQAKFRTDMSLVVESVVVQIRDASPMGGFVKQDKEGRWYEIGTKLAREKVAHTFRDCMTGKLRRNKVCSAEEKREELMQAQDNIFQSCQITFSTSSFDAELKRLRSVWKAKKEAAM